MSEETTSTTVTTRRVFYDTEFVEFRETISLISIGLVADDGRTYYAQSTEFAYDAAHSNAFVREHVLPRLLTCPSFDSEYAHRYTHVGRCANPQCPWRNRAQMRDEVIAFLAHDVPQVHENMSADAPMIRTELWGDYCAYDHVALAQLFGSMVEWPLHLPMYTRDLEQWRAELHALELPDHDYHLDGGLEHNALADARCTMRAWEYLDSMHVVLGYS